MPRIFEPFQQVLLKRRLCAGCTSPLDKATIRVPLNEKKTLVQCKCRRRYIYETLTNSYRRATHEEDAEYLNKKQNLM
jgi:RNase P subunit RPR2